MRPFRMECMRVAIVKQGSCCPVVNSRPYACEPGDMIFINWGSVLDDDSFAPDTRFEGFALTEEYLRQLFGLDIPTMLKNPGLCFKVHLSEEESKVYKCYLDTIMSLSKTTYRRQKQSTQCSVCRCTQLRRNAL